MSARSKITLGASVVFCAGCLIYDLYEKAFDRARLHEGVVRDLGLVERQTKNLAELDRQKVVERQYKGALIEKNESQAGS